jgi:hypothetical protein
MKIEVALLLYNRPDHSRAVLQSLEDSGFGRVRVFLDAPASDAVAQNQEKMLRDLDRVRGLTIELHRHPERQGLARSVRFAMRSIFEDSDAAILLEDDCVVRPGGMEFLTEGLKALQHDKRVRSICAYLHPCNFFRAEAEPLLLQRFCTWGWGTWRDRWKEHDPDLRTVVEKLQAKGIRIEDFAQDIAELCRSERYLTGNVDIWSVPWILEHYLTDTYCVYPCDSLIENIGFDGSGANCAATNRFASAGRTQARPWNFRQLGRYVENEDILKEFLDRHGLDAYPRF